MKRDTEGSMQHVVSAVLRTGVIASVSVGLIGGIYNLLLHGRDTVNFRTFGGSPVRDRHVATILEQAIHLQPRGLMMLGLLLLLMTPIVRVIVSLFGFIKEKDRVFVTVTAIVLLTLLASLVFGGVAE